MDTATPVAVASQPSSRRRLNLLQLLWFGAAAALLIVGGLYTLRYLSATSFEQQRAFRALDETAGQLDNMQGAIAGLLKLVKEDLLTQCADNKKQAQCEAYKKRIAIEGVEPDVVKVDQSVPRLACTEGVESLFVLHARQAEVPSVAIRCMDADRPVDEVGAAGAPWSEQVHGTVNEMHPVASGTVSDVPASTASPAQAAKPVKPQRSGRYVLKGSLTDIVAGFISQSFFDEVLIALEDGTVIASVPRSDAFANDVRKALHPARITTLNILDASPLLRPEAAASGTQSAQDKIGAPAIPKAQPIMSSHTIAGDHYQVFVRLMRPKYPTYVYDDTAMSAKEQQVFYLVGLRRADLSGDIASALGPGSRFWLSIFFLLALFAWPLANVKSKPAADAISWSELVACLFSLIFIPATLAIGAVWCWSNLALESWADRGAANYAQSIAGYLRAELGQDLRLLAQYRDARDPGMGVCGWERPGLPISLGPRVIAVKSQPEEGSSETCRLQPADGKAHWSPLSSAFATDAEGTRNGGLTAFSAPIVRSDARYSTRQYFQAVRLNQTWLAQQVDGSEQFVAQRVFSFSDGARVLQLAIRRNCAKGGNEAFCGIVSGGSRIHGLSAAVLPPLLKFAVIDRRTGSVLFHADDRRSLSENLFVETEQNESLRAAASANRSTYFNGRYLGETHRFVYLPMDGPPWGIVVMYSLRELGELSWHAGLTALAAYAGVMLILAAGLVLMLLLRARWHVRGKNPAYVLWPRAHHTELRAGTLARLLRGACFYERCGIGFYGVVVLAVVIYELAELHEISALTSVMAGLWFLAVALIIWLRRRELYAAPSTGGSHAIAESHTLCLAIALTLISALPAAWMALGYQDAQVQGLIRDGLVGASQAVMRRHDIIDKDLRRWGAITKEGGLDAWELTMPSATMQVPGFATDTCHHAPKSSCVLELRVFESPPLYRAIATLTLDFWRRETWRAAVPTENQLRRIALLTQEKGKDPSCYGYEGPPGMHGDARRQTSSSWTGCDFRGEDGHGFRLAAVSFPSAAGAWKAIAPDDATFSIRTSAIFYLLPAVIVLGLIATLASFANRRLFGYGLKRSVGQKIDERTVYYTPAAAQELGTSLQDVSQRINLAYSPEFLRANSFRPIRQTYVLEDLDLAVADASRRSSILEWLEELVSSDAKLIIICRRKPLERLNRAPSGEIVRWQVLLDSLYSASRPVPPANQAKSPALSDREKWQLYTREERLLLHQLASGAIVNPANRKAIESLAGTGDIAFDPWPTIANPDFEAFVKRVDAEPEMKELLQQSAEGGKSTRRTVIGVLLFVVLVLVVWFSWVAGDQFKFLTAILAGSLAFLGQIGQALSFVRSAGQSGK